MANILILGGGLGGVTAAESVAKKLATEAETDKQGVETTDDEEKADRSEIEQRNALMIPGQQP